MQEREQQQTSMMMSCRRFCCAGCIVLLLLNLVQYCAAEIQIIDIALPNNDRDSEEAISGT